jgi:hypothetical protein
MNAQAGMQAGAAVGGPWGAVVGGLVGAGMQEYGGGDAPGASGGGPFMGGGSETATYGTGIDKSGMVFNFGAGTSATTSSQRAYNKPPAEATAQGFAYVDSGALAYDWRWPAGLVVLALTIALLRKKGQ